MDLQEQTLHRTYTTNQIFDISHRQYSKDVALWHHPGSPKQNIFIVPKNNLRHTLKILNTSVKKDIDVILFNNN